MILLKKNMNLIGGEIIGDSNYIGTCFNGLIQNQPPKELNPFRFLQKSYILIIMIEQLIFYGNSQLKELDIVDFYKRKQANENMESEMKDMDVKQGKNAYSEEDNFDEAIPIQIRKEITTEAY